MITTNFMSLAARFNMQQGKGLFGRKGPISKSGSGYSIQVLKSESYNSFSGQASVSFEYFDVDKDGLILRSPRGYAKEFNKKVVISDIAERFKEQG